jgi:hypothetical protein
LAAILEERERADEEAKRRTGEWQITANLAWVRPWDPVSGLYPSLRAGPDTEEAGDG